MNSYRAFSGLAFCLLTLVNANAFANSGSNSQDDDIVSYDQIVQELSTAQPAAISNTKMNRNEADPFRDVMIHGGIGLASTFGQIAAGNDRIRMNQQGMQAALGIDLFSKHWFAEGTARAFGNSEYSTSSVKLKEFDLKVYYRDVISGGLTYKLGAGLAARYLTVESRTQGRLDYSTPASVLAGGVDMYLTKAISIGAELTARNTIVSDTIDKSSIDGTLRLDTHF